MMEAVCTSETSVNIYFTTPQYFPEDSKLNRPLDGGSSETLSQHEQQQNVQVFPGIINYKMLRKKINYKLEF
jgi:hypothetical protein